MKALLLVASLLTFTLTQAQTVVLDFETDETSTLFQYFGSTLDQDSTQIIANPDPSGINTSDNVTEWIKPAGAEVWGGAFSKKSLTVDLTENTQVCIDVWYNSPGNLALKLENGDQANWITQQDVTETMQWVEVCFNTLDASIEDPGTPAAGGTYTTVTLFTDFGESPDADRTYYIDNIETRPAPVVPVDVTFSVDMNQYEGMFETVYVSGTFNDWAGDANPLSDDDEDGVWTGTVVDLPSGSHEYKFQVDQWADDESLPAFSTCTKVDPSGQFINRVLAVQEDTELETVCFASCFACGEGVKITVNLGQGGTEVSDEGFFIAGGNNFGLPGEYPLTDGGNGVHTITVERAVGFSSYYTFANGACADFSCKENIAGQDCADPGNFNDRFMGPVMQDTVISTCFGECRDDTDCTIVEPRQVIFTVDMSEYTGTFTTAFVSGTFNGWSGNANPLNDLGDGLWGDTLTLDPGMYEFKFQVDEWTDQEFFADGDPCTVTDPSGNYINRGLTIGDEDISVCFLFNSCDMCETSGLNSLTTRDDLFTAIPTVVSGSTLINFHETAHDKEISVLTSMGQQVAAIRVESGQEQYDLDLSRLVPGIYFLNVRAGNTQQTTRLLIAR